MNKDIFARNALLLNALNELEPRLKEAKLDIMLLKGAAYLELGVFGLDERQMSDLDILVKPVDLKYFVETLKDLGFREMPESSTAWHRTVKETLPPVIIDLHDSLRHVREIDEVWRSKVKIRENVYAPAPEELLLFAAAHPVLHHGFFDGKAAKDVRAITEKAMDPGKLLEKALEKAEARGIAGLFAAALAISFPEKAGGLRAVISMKEFFLSPLIKLSFRKHYPFNEYLLPFLYNPGYGFKRLFPGREFMLRRHGSAGLKSRLKRIIKIFARIAGK